MATVEAEGKTKLDQNVNEKEMGNGEGSGNEPSTQAVDCFAVFVVGEPSFIWLDPRQHICGIGLAGFLPVVKTRNSNRNRNRHRHRNRNSNSNWSQCH